MQVDTMPRIRDLKLSPDINPLLEENSIHLKKRYVKSGVKADLTDLNTGEVTAASIIHTIEEKDDEQFVKVFAAGIAANYDLSRGAQRVFTAVLQAYEATPMSQGFADAVELYWFGDGLAGKDIGMSEATFNRGLRELLGKRFLYPRSPTTYWVNPSLFFKGNRVMFIQEYVRKRKANEKTKKEKLEAQGQQTLSI